MTEEVEAPSGEEYPHFRPQGRGSLATVSFQGPGTAAVECGSSS